MSEPKNRSTQATVLLALGVVFGDIGTSPLYAYETAVMAGGGAPAALGAASLIVWTLLLVVTVKYGLLVMRADFHGEGGILAMFAGLRKTGVFEKNPIPLACGAAHRRRGAAVWGRCHHARDLGAERGGGD